MIDVVGVGACSIDFVYVLPATPRPDSDTAKLRISRHLTSPGGQTATALCTCAAFGLRTRFIGSVGTDVHAATLQHALQSRGVDIGGVVRREGPTPYAVILVDEHHGERVVLWDRPAAMALGPGDVPAAALAEAHIVHVDDVDVAAALHAASAARAAARLVTSDIERTDEHARALIDAVDVAILAEQVPTVLEPDRPLEQALRALRTHPDQIVVVTRGARGAMLLAGGEIYTVPGHQVRVVDTTGAGDVFRGALIAALRRGTPPGEMLAFANAAAAVSCTRLGAMAGVPTIEETEAMVRQT